MSTDPSLSSPFDGHQSLSWLTYDNCLDSGPWDTLFPTCGLPESLHKAVPKRQRDYILGRYCATRALSRLIPGSSSFSVAVGPKRQPIWPQGIVGSISHTEGMVLAWVGLNSVFKGLGIDAEIIRQKPTSPLRNYIFTPEEWHSLRAKVNGTIDDNELFIAGFSAKESFYKCLFPVCNEFFGFHDAWINASDLGSSWNIRLLKPLPGIPANLELPVTVRMLQQWLITTVAWESKSSLT